MITSTSNQRIKRIRALQSDRKVRTREGTLVIEGSRLLREALTSRFRPKLVLYTEDFAASGGGATLLERANCETLLVADNVLKSASDTQSPQGVLTVVPIPALPLPSQPSFILIVDALQNPGNLGAILRSAEAAGLDGVFLSPGTVDSSNPKVVRGAAGAHFRLPVQAMPDWATIKQTAPPALTVFLADVSGGTYYDRVNWREPVALIVSGEAHGASREAERIAAARVSIPMAGGAESLNVAVATGILLFEAARQRALPAS